MGRLAGFRYRDIINILKTFGFEFIDKPRAAMKFGTILKPKDLQQFQTIPEICLKGH